MKQLPTDIQDALYNGCIAAWNIWCKTHGKLATEERLDRFLKDVFYVAQQILIEKEPESKVLTQCECWQITGVQCRNQVPKSQLVTCIYQRTADLERKVRLAPDCARLLSAIAVFSPSYPAMCVAPESNRRPLD